MRQIQLTEINGDRPTVLLMNGGGQPPFNKYHKVTRTLEQFNCNLVAVELPGHGKSSFEQILTVEEMLERFRTEFSQISNLYEQVAIFGYSLGGLLGMKAIEYQLDNYEFAIVLGAAIIIEKAQEKVMKKFTTKEFFENMRWLDRMKEYHQDGWKELLHSVHDMLYVDSPIFLNPESLWEQYVDLHLILGDRDEVADYQLHQQYSSKDNFYLYVLEETEHFDYFTRSWRKMKEKTTDIVSQYLEFKND